MQLLAEFDRLNNSSYYETIEISALNWPLPTGLHWKFSEFYHSTITMSKSSNGKCLDAQGEMTCKILARLASNLQDISLLARLAHHFSLGDALRGYFWLGIVKSNFYVIIYYNYFIFLYPHRLYTCDCMCLHEDSHPLINYIVQNCYFISDDFLSFGLGGKRILLRIYHYTEDSWHCMHAHKGVSLQ